jgi:hypothetical protein
MDPWLEHPAIWPDVHNSLIAAIRDEVVPRVAPRYYVGIEQRTYALKGGGLIFVGRPDIAVGHTAVVDSAFEPVQLEESTAVGILDVEVPEIDRLEEWFLEIHDVESGSLVTVLEVLSPANKIHAKGRKKYVVKRGRLLQSQANLVEIDLLRAGEPMPLQRKPPSTHYRILVSREATRPKAKLFTFNVRLPLPAIPIPLLPGDIEPELDLGSVLHALYDRARFDLRLNYNNSPAPPLSAEDADWARSIVASKR